MHCIPSEFEHVLVLCPSHLQQAYAAPSLTLLATSDDLCNSKLPIHLIGSPSMLKVVAQELPLQVKQLTLQLDAALAVVYRALGLALCILAATASSLHELEAAAEVFKNSKKALSKIAKSLLRSDANSVALQHVRYLEGVVSALLDRKRHMLEELLQSQQMLKQAALSAAKSCSQQDKQRLASAMAAVTKSDSAEVWFGQMPDGQLYVVPQDVVVDFGAQLTNAPARQSALHIINSTAMPLQLQLLSTPTAGEAGDALADSFATPIDVRRQQQLVSPGGRTLFEFTAGTSALAGKAAAHFLLAVQSSSCDPVTVQVQAEYQQLSIAVDTAAVNYGIIPSYKERVKRVLRLTNETGVAVRVKNAISTPHGIKSKFSTDADTLLLQPYESQRPLGLYLHPVHYSSELVQGAKLLVAAASAANVHEVSISADIQQPQLQLRVADTQEVVSPGGIVEAPAVQPGQEKQLVLELVNTGEGRT